MIHVEVYTINYNMYSEAIHTGIYSAFKLLLHHRDFFDKFHMSNDIVTKYEIRASD